MTKQHQHAGAGSGDIAMAELLDLDAEVLHTYLADVTAWLADLAGNRPVRRILDLGSGTGTGTFALLERLKQACATALDVSPQMLHHLENKARARGIQDRVRTVRADLNGAWPDLGTVDLVWIASALHHMTDPGHILTQAFDVLRPGGLLIVTEMDFFPRFLPDEVGLGRPGLEARIHAALGGEQPAPLPPRLLEASFTLEAERPFGIDLRPPLPPATGRYAQASLSRLRDHLDGHIDAEDLATLDTLIADGGPHSLLHRDDLTVHTTRTVWVARRP
jgi:SAM-dependent methyltransferase